MAKMNVFTLDNLNLYDELLKNYMAEEDAKSLKTVAIEGNTLKFYKVVEPVGDTAPAFEINLPETDLSGLIPKITGATAGHVVTAKADGTVADGGVALADLATKAEVKAVENKTDANTGAINDINNETTGILAKAKEYADGKDAAISGAQSTADAAKQLAESNKSTFEAYKTANDAAVKAAKDAADAAQADVDALEGKVGTVPADKTVVQMIADAQAAATYDDTQVKADIKANADAIEVLNGTGAGSVSKQITDAFNDFATKVTDDGVVNSYKELIDWAASHGADAAEMAAAITALENILDGIGGEGESATVVAYVQSAIDALKIGDYAKASDLAAAIDRIAALEGKMTTVEGKVSTLESEMDAVEEKASANETAISGISGRVTTAEGEIDTLQASMSTVEGKVSALEGKVGDGFEAIPEATIRGLFA